MIEDAIWQRELVAALHSENLFMAQHPAWDRSDAQNDLKPNLAKATRAVDNIRAWRTYLPAPCVARMIDEGWQWSN